MFYDLIHLYNIWTVGEGIPYKFLNGTKGVDGFLLVTQSGKRELSIMRLVGVLMTSDQLKINV